MRSLTRVPVTAAVIAAPLVGLTGTAVAAQGDHAEVSGGCQHIPPELWGEYGCGGPWDDPQN